jgi:glutathione synthase/RimK-type ligase-like ATP-grasp enzyme
VNKSVLFATCASRPEGTSDDAILAETLRGLDMHVASLPWDAIVPGPETPPVVLRSTWDYHKQPGRFAEWLRALARARARVFNPSSVALWNIDRAYLRELEAGGVRIPRTRWLDQADAAQIAAVLAEESWRTAVLKPRIGATAHGMSFVRAGAAPGATQLAAVAEHGAYLQEFQSEITEQGETSLVYVDGHFSHAVRKRPRVGDFRVQSDFGGTWERTTASPDLQAFAGHVLGVAPGPCLYARVDVVDTWKGPTLNELALIDPELYFRVAPEAATMMAKAIQAHLRTADATP